jgi:hypothetical protein
VVINIRGVNGSGKSTLVRGFLERYRSVPLFGVCGPKRPEAYAVYIKKDSAQPLFVLGPYLTPTGGMDVLTGRGFATVISLLDRYSERGHVLFEGVTFAVSFGTIGEWLEKHKATTIVGFLEVSLEAAIASIKARSGDSASFGRVKEKVAALKRVRKRMDGLGMRTETLTRETGFETVQGWLLGKSR